MPSTRQCRTWLRVYSISGACCIGGPLFSVTILRIVGSAGQAGGVERRLADTGLARHRFDQHRMKGRLWAIHGHLTEGRGGVGGYPMLVRAALIAQHEAEAFQPGFDLSAGEG